MTTEDDWGTTDYSNIIIEQKRLTERKLVEESDNKIANELFQERERERLPSITNTFMNANTTTHNNNNVKPIKKEHTPIHFPKPIRPNLELFVKLQKETSKKHDDTFGDYVFDKYEDNYIDLEDRVKPNK
jgi:hypothetical protein